MIYALSVGAMTLTATAIAGTPFLGLLRRLKVGKQISEWGPESHQAKAGTPTMGGLLVLVAIGAFSLAANLFGRYSIGLPLAVMAALGALGFLDDLGSLQGRSGLIEALNKRVKFVAFVGIGVAAAFGLYEGLELSAANVPYAGRYDLDVWYIPIAVGVVVLTAGGVAVTDGLDGLAAGTSAVAFGAYGAIALVQEQTFIATYCFTVAGALLGFLWYNSHPAQMFMGDTGALALGGGLATAAFMTGQWLVLPIIGIIFVLEGASDVLQVGYYRLSGGKRIFRMAPLHHHFEKLGWSEPQVVQRFWIIGILGATVGTILALEV
ncbi:MAG TPA: phospho-N-acetylmuramoyl-pentapeptide-transferase [Dehalococcoidia bacterium]|nr:phospho-N-acetylmuramoyl-pentapeptide-transferase [Dehalococcoidia bacterium]